MFVKTEVEITIPFDEQGFLDQPFELPTDPLGQLLVEKLLAVGKVQLKMTVAEDFQFSHQGVPPLGVSAPEKVRPFFYTKTEFTQKKLRYLRYWYQKKENVGSNRICVRERKQRGRVSRWMGDKPSLGTRRRALATNPENRTFKNGVYTGGSSFTQRNPGGCPVFDRVIGQQTKVRAVRMHDGDF